MSNLSHALAVAREIGPIIPVHPYVPPGEPGYYESKAPITALVRNGSLDATTDEATIRRWWTARPDARIGVPLGNRIALDEDGELGFLPPPTRTHSTPKGRRHFIYAANEAGVVPKGKRGVYDVKSGNGYVIWPTPGSGYAVLDGRPMEPWPADLLPATRTASGGRTPPRSAAAGEEGDQGADEAEREALALIRHDEIRKRLLTDVARGQRSDKAFGLAAELRGAGYTNHEIATILYGFRPYRAHARERRADHESWIETDTGRILDVLDGRCPHPGRNCVDAGCRNASIWLLSHAFTSGMRQIRDSGGGPRRDVLRQVFGHRLPKWQAEWIVTTGVARKYWTVEPTRNGTRGPSKLMLVPHVRNAVSQVFPVPRNVDPSTGEILSDSLAITPTGAGGGAGGVLIGVGKPALTSTFAENLAQPRQESRDNGHSGFKCLRCPAPVAYSKCPHGLEAPH